jgi:hypothetical protein
MVDFGPPIGVQKMLIGRLGADGSRCFSLSHRSVADASVLAETLPPLVSTSLGLELSEDVDKRIIVAKVSAKGPAG